MTQDFTSIFSADHIPAELTERAETVAIELASHAGVRAVVMGHFAMELADAWHKKLTPLDGDGAPIILLPRVSRWLVLKLGESDVIFVFSGRESAIARARSLAIEQGVAFFAIGPAGRVTDHMDAARPWTIEELDVSETEPAPVSAPVEATVTAAPAENTPPEITIEKQGRRYAVLVDNVVVATASNKQRALRKADALRQDPDLVASKSDTTADDDSDATAGATEAAA